MPYKQRDDTVPFSSGVNCKLCIVVALILFFAPQPSVAQSSSIPLASSPNPSNYGQPVTLTATVPSGATGKVTFYDGTTILGVRTVSGGDASLTAIQLPSGNRSLWAYYSGDAGNSAASSMVVPQTILPRASLALRPAVSYTVGAGPDSIAVADFNGDNKLDLVVTNYNSNNICLLLGNGDGTFQTADNYATVPSPGIVVVGDFNEDGSPDLAVVSYDAGDIRVLLGNGDGTFQPAASVNSGPSPVAMAVGDFNGDGKADLAVAAKAGATDSIRVLLGNGDGTFQAPVNYSVSSSGTYSVAVGDLNRDGKADLVFGTSSGLIHTLLGNGDGTFEPAASDRVGSSPQVVTIGDFNNDGQLDIAVADNTYSGGIELLLGNGDGTLQTAVPVYMAPSPYFVAPVDLNGDGTLDLIYFRVSSISGGALGFLAGYGDGTFQSPVVYSNPGFAFLYPSYGIATGDFNGDGKVDVAAVDGVYNNTVSVLLGGAITDITVALSHGGGFTQGEPGTYSLTVSNIGDIASTDPVTVTDTLPSGFSATSITGAGWTCTLATLACTRSDPLPAGASYPSIIINVNTTSEPGSATNIVSISGGNDGNSNNNTASDTTNVRITTTVSLTSSPNPSVLGHAVTLTATVSRGTGKVTFYDSTTLLGVGTLIGGTATFTTYQLPSGSHALTARYDGDANYGPTVSSAPIQVVNPANTNGAQGSVIYKVGSYPSSIVSADLNSDGKADLITSNYLDVSILLGNGDGTFQAAKSVGALQGNQVGNVSGMAVGDIDGDGKPDLVIAYNGYSNGWANTLSALLGNGDGSFQNAVQIPGYLSTGNLMLTITDINRDGAADIVVLGTAGISVFIGNGDGTFHAPLTDSATGFFQGYCALTDLNNDGNLDVVFTSGGDGSSVSVMLGNGDGTFRAPVNYTGYIFRVESLVTGDFNSDGNSDVAEVQFTGVEWLKGNGDGTLQPPFVSFNVSSFVPGNFTIAGDFNGDGKLDIASSSGAAVTIAFGNGDGTFQTTAAYFFGSASGGLLLGDFNCDGKPDFAVVDHYGNSVSVYLGAYFSSLGITSTHTGNFIAGTSGSYKITVGNPLFTTTSNVVTVTDTLPSGLTATAISGMGWNCDLAGLSCSRSDTLGPGNSYPPITLSVNVSGSLTSCTLTNQVSISYNGAVNTATDPTTVHSASATTPAASPKSIRAEAGCVLTTTPTEWAHLPALCRSSATYSLQLSCAVESRCDIFNSPF